MDDVDGNDDDGELIMTNALECSRRQGINMMLVRMMAAASMRPGMHKS